MLNGSENNVLLFHDYFLEKEIQLNWSKTGSIFTLCQDFEAVWRVVDENNDGAIDYGEFLRAFIGKKHSVKRLFVPTIEHIHKCAACWYRFDSLVVRALDRETSYAQFYDRNSRVVTI